MLLFFAFDEQETRCIISDRLEHRSIIHLDYSSNPGLISDKYLFFDYQYIQKKDSNLTIWNIKSNHPGLKIGDLVQLDRLPFSLPTQENVNQKLIYRIMNISHVAHQCPKERSYYNTALLLKDPVDTSYWFSRYLSHVDSLTNTILLAKIIGNDNHPNLDEHGNYQITFLFDITQQIITAPKLHYYGGKNDQHTYGIHFPLRKNSIVAIGFIEGKCDRPIILGALNSPQSPDVVTKQNSTQNRLRTYGGNEIIFDDRGIIDLHTKDLQQQLSFHKTQNEKTICITTKKGNIEIKANQSINICSNNNIQSISQKDHIIDASSYQILTKNGDITINAQKSIQYCSPRLKIGTIKGQFSAHLKKQATFETKTLEIHNTESIIINAGDQLSIQGEKFCGNGNNKMSVNNQSIINANNLSFSTLILDGVIINKSN